eukprot:1582242-Alexandrium_andersonii.AAC.1
MPVLVLDAPPVGQCCATWRLTSPRARLGIDARPLRMAPCRPCDPARADRREAERRGEGARRAGEQIGERLQK